MLNRPQGQRPVEVRTVRGSPSGEISQMDAQPILPPERVGPLTLVPDSLIIADDYVHSSSRSTHCLSCRNPTMPGLPYCEYCGNAKVKELPENHQSKVEAISQSHMSRGLLPQPWRAENLPRSRIAQHGEGPSSATVIHPSFEELSSQNRQQDAPGGLASMVERPEEDESLCHQKWLAETALIQCASTFGPF